jgi:hypothetical protein
LLFHCAMSVPAIARAATTPSPRSGHYTAATLKTYEGAWVRLDLKGGSVALVHVRKVWRLHLRVVHSNGRYASIPISRIVRVSLAELDQRAAKRRSKLPGSSSLRPKASPSKNVPGRIVRNVGMVMTLGALGAVVTVAGLGFAFGNEFGTAVQSVGGVSLVVLLAGIPTWIVGGVDTRIHSGNPQAEKNRKWYRAWGMGLTFGGLGLAALSAGIGVAVVARSYDMITSMLTIIIAGTIGGSGLLTSLLIGVPMWSAAAADSGASGAPGPKQRSPPPVPPSTAMGFVPDPHHQRWTGRRALRHQPRAHIFTVGGRF